MMEIFENPIFQQLTEPEIRDMLTLARTHRRTYTRHSVIFHTGDLIQEVGIVLSGSVNIENVDAWGNTSLLSKIPTGHIFAETYVLCREPMLVDAVAGEDCEILFLQLNTLLERTNASQGWYDQLLRNILMITARKNLTLSSRIFCTSAKTIRGRLLTYLSAIAVRTGSSTFQIPFDRQQLADYLNLDRSALSKELGKMQADGLIRCHKNTFTLL